MAYFSNGSEGRDYEEQYCSRCANHREHPDQPMGDVADCAVWALHFDYNYEQGGKTKLGKAIKNILDTLIPMDGIYAGECSMFLERQDVVKQETYLEKLPFANGPVFGVDA